MPAADQNPIALYVHWPWCVRKCPYCDFNSHAAGPGLDEKRYLETLLADLDASIEIAGRRPLSSIFFGGGTPSLMSVKGFEFLMQGIARRLPFAEGIEITLEANPGTLEASRFAGYAANGVNRFSIGVQSFDDAHLKTLGRIHNRAQALEAVQTAARLVDNFNLDVMYALPRQTMDELESDLRMAVESGATHLSFYELTIEEGTAFYKREPAGLPDSDTAAQMGDLVQERLAAAGFEHYEVSGYARPGRRCRHNLNYWMFGDYIGIGAGAHGKITTAGGILRTERRGNPVLYMDDGANHRFGTQLSFVLVDSLPFEFMLNVLRLSEGVPASLWSETTGLSFEVIRPKVDELRREGLLVKDESRLACTPLGRNWLSTVQERFLTDFEA